MTMIDLDSKLRDNLRCGSTHSYASKRSFATAALKPYDWTEVTQHSTKSIRVTGNYRDLNPGVLNIRLASP